jgi:signal peptidase I
MDQRTREIPRLEAGEKKKKKSLVREYAEAIVVAVLLALLIRTFVVQAFTIPSGSMSSTLLVGDYILVNKFIYHFRDPARGDIIVFKFPVDEKRDFIKRIVAVGGEEVFIKGRQVFVNGRPLEESYARYSDQSPHASSEYGPVTVPADSYFVMGDNRDNSQDSRYWGFLKGEKIRGKAFMIYWSWDGEKHWLRWRRLGKVIW